MARGPVLGLALLATVSAGAAVADGEDGGVVLGDSMADVARSLLLTPNRTALVLMPLIPVRALAFDAAIRSVAGSTSTTNFEPRRVDGIVEVQSQVTSVIFGLSCGLRVSDKQPRRFLRTFRVVYACFYTALAPSSRASRAVDAAR